MESFIAIFPMRRSTCELLQTRARRKVWCTVSNRYLILTIRHVPHRLRGGLVLVCMSNSMKWLITEWVNGSMDGWTNGQTNG